MPLTDVQCRSAKASSKSYKVYDAKGLYLEVIPTGKRFWRFRYNYFGKEKRISLGEYPEISLTAARSDAISARTLVKAGIDPSLQRQQQRIGVSRLNSCFMIFWTVQTVVVLTGVFYTVPRMTALLRPLRRLSVL